MAMTTETAGLVDRWARCSSEKMASTPRSSVPTEVPEAWPDSEEPSCRGTPEMPTQSPSRVGSWEAATGEFRSPIPRLTRCSRARCDCEPVPTKSNREQGQSSLLAASKRIWVRLSPGSGHAGTALEQLCDDLFQVQHFSAFCGESKCCRQHFGFEFVEKSLGVLPVHVSGRGMV